MDFEIIDNVYRSRKTLMDILEMRGYDTTPFSNFSPTEIAIAGGVADTFAPLSFVAKKRDDATKSCDVRYARVSRQKMQSFFTDFPEDGTVEVIVMMLEPIADLHHQTALKLFFTKKLHVSFFHIPYIVNNPLNNVLVPKHEIVPADQHKAIMEKFHMTAKSKFPLIKFHVDPIIRLLGGVPGDIVRITRPSPSAGWYEFYRVVSP